MIGAYAIASYPVAGAIGFRQFAEKFYASYFNTFGERTVSPGELEEWNTLAVSGVDFPLGMTSLEVSTKVIGWATQGVSWISPTATWSGGNRARAQRLIELEVLDQALSAMIATTSSSVDVSPVGAMRVKQRRSTVTLETYSPFLDEYLK